MAKNKTTLGQESIKDNAITNTELASDPSSLSKVSGGAATINTTNKTVNIGSSYGLNVAGNTNISGALASSSLPSFSGVLLDEATNWIGANLFDSQPYIEGEKFPSGGVWSCNVQSTEYATINNVYVPFGKVILSENFRHLRSDYIPVSAGEVLYGEIWAMRPSGATGTAGLLYYGIERFDKDKKPISDNTGRTCFVANAVTIPADGVWKKYNNTTTIPSSHTPYSGSDGGPVRYIKVMVYINYNSGTIPTYWGGVTLRRQAIVRDEGLVEFKGNAKFNKPVEFGSTISGGQSGAIRIQNSNGYLDLGPKNTAYAHLVTDRASFHFNREVKVSSGNIGSQSEDLSLRTSGTTRITIKNDTGNVGIGTTAPGANLEVTGTSGQYGMIINKGGLGSLRWGSGAQGYLSWGTNQVMVGGLSGNALALHSNGSAKMFISTSGDIGIGTTSPKEKLHSVGNIRIGDLVSSYIHFSEIAAGDGFSIHFDGEGGLDNNLLHIAGGTGTPTSHIKHVTVRRDTGNVGINNASPSYQLDVSGESRISGKLRLVADSTRAHLNLNRIGTANPSSTDSGDFWYRSNNLYYNDQGTIRAVAHTRSWSTVGQAEAETGTATSQRLWTAQRVRQSTRAVLKAFTVTIPANSPNTYVDLTHNQGNTSYAAILSPNTAARHVYWSNKAANTIRINIDFPHDENIVIDVGILAI